MCKDMLKVQEKNLFDVVSTSVSQISLSINLRSLHTAAFLRQAFLRSLASTET